MKLWYFIAATFSLILFAPLAFAQSGGVRGKVKFENGSGAGGVKVSVRAGESAEDEVAAAVTDSKGNFQILGIKPGTYSVVFTKSSYSTGTLKRKIEISTITVDLGDRLVLKQDPAIFAYIRGSVFDPDGRSVQGAHVELYRIFTDGKTKKIKDTDTGESGEFAFRLPPDAANYRVTVKVNRAEPDAKDVLVDGAEIYRLVPFNLRPVVKN
jgi:hypothetical protein